MSSQVEPIDAQLKTLADQVKTLESCRPVASPSLEERLDELQLEVGQVRRCAPLLTKGLGAWLAPHGSTDGVQGARRVMMEKVEVELKQLDGRLAKQLASWRQEVDCGFAAKVDKSELVKLLSRKMDTRTC